ncbi:YbjN domain-containing protein [Sphingobacterium alkalisoli]|uniref:YbjN domain-containing protein n=1 Tax=Sphingobacterium alkalisoli TaxID=1874115 RepID=A0A4U0H081_9SPHI|nr:YbjN domain-containing protein [Sphingobacterium alkalisoli]TJY64414.1 YbjN domain-containing protein [Sphingobacterium alkalisoli]GGH21901.1 hypothetical protein GCM10011418_28090 [Sphingobacterium alkalisoli]
MHFKKVEKFITDLDFTIVSKNAKDGVLLVESESDGIRNLIIGVAPPIIIFEQYLFTLREDNLFTFRSMLIKNRDIVHGAFALTEDGRRAIFRYTLQLHNLDQNEFEAAINSLSLLLSEYYEQLIKFSKL